MSRMTSAPEINTTLTDVTAAAVDNGTSLLHEALIRPPFFKESLSMAFILVLSFFYCIVFLLAITNNGIVLTVIYRFKQMRSVTNYFLANLAIADITVSVVVLPITLLTNLCSGKKQTVVIK